MLNRVIRSGKLTWIQIVHISYKSVENQLWSIWIRLLKLLASFQLFSLTCQFSLCFCRFCLGLFFFFFAYVICLADYLSIVKFVGEESRIKCSTRSHKSFNANPSYKFYACKSIAQLFLLKRSQYNNEKKIKKSTNTRIRYILHRVDTAVPSRVAVGHK